MQTTLRQYTQNIGWSAPLPDIDSDKTLILVFAAQQYINNLAPIQQLQKKFPQASILGCSSAGEIHQTQIYDKSLSVSITQFEQTPIKLVKARLEATNTIYQIATDLAQQLYTDDLRGIFILSDGLAVNGSELINGLNTILPANIVVTGGLAADQDQFKKTWVLANDTLESNIIAAVGFYGSHIRIGHASQGGWDMFGPERTITRSKGNMLYELDDKPALKLYRDYLGELATGLPATGLLYPLSLRTDSHSDKHLVRTILGIDEAKQALIFAGDVPENYLAKLMRANFDRLIDGAESAAQTIMQTAMQPQLAIAISCVGRRLVLGERTEDELDAVAEQFPNVPMLGFYSYGEISPYTTGHCDFHNQTMTLTTLQEIIDA